MIFPVFMVANNIGAQSYPFIYSNPSSIGLPQSFTYSQTSTVSQASTFPSYINNENKEAPQNPHHIKTVQTEQDLKKSSNLNSLSEEDIMLLNYFLGDDDEKNQEDTQSPFLPSYTSGQTEPKMESNQFCSSYIEAFHSPHLEEKIITNRSIQTFSFDSSKFFDTSSPQNKSTDAQVSCTCRKSGCNKLYCHCFRAGKFCSESCSCTSCFNTKGNVSANSKKLQQKQQQMAKQSCQCRRTSCLKHYCACFNSGKYCTDQCRCTECCNFAGSQKLTVKRIVDSYQKDTGNK